MRNLTDELIKTKEGKSIDANKIRAMLLSEPVLYDALAWSACLDKVGIRKFDTMLNEVLPQHSLLLDWTKPIPSGFFAGFTLSQLAVYYKKKPMCSKSMSALIIHRYS